MKTRFKPGQRYYWNNGTYANIQEIEDNNANSMVIFPIGFNSALVGMRRSFILYEEDNKRVILLPNQDKPENV